MLLRSALLILLGLALQGAIVGAASAKEKVDLIVLGDHVVTLDNQNPLVKKGAVAIADGKIVGVGSAADFDDQYAASEVIEGEGRALLPGLVNGHTHAAMILFRGLVDDLDLMTWLTEYIFPMEGRFVDESFVRAGVELACYEMIRTGTTTFADMYFYPEIAGSVVDTCGLRAILGAPMIDFPSPGFEGWDDSFAAGQAFAREWKGRHARITPALAPHAPYTVAAEHFRAVASAAKELGVPVLTHVSEDQAEIRTIKERHKTTSIHHLSALGLLEGPIVMAHVVWPEPTEMLLLRNGNVGVVHNPTSNLKTAAGVSPVPTMLKEGVKIGLGTDGAASNNNLDMWQEMHLTALIHKGVGGDPKVLPASDVLHMATLGGAQAIGLDDRIGSLEAGKQADLIQVDLNKPSLTPLYDVISHLVYAVNGRDVVTTIVDGQVLMREGEVRTLDKSQVVETARALARQISEALEEPDTGATDE